jgi:hypothetical protein
VWQSRGSQGQERVSSLKVRHGSLEGSRNHRVSVKEAGAVVSKVPGLTDGPFTKGGCHDPEDSRTCVQMG